MLKVWLKHFFQQNKYYGLVVVLIVVVSTIEWFSHNLLNYQRQAIADGEVWRLLSGHFAHLNTMHFLLNMSVFLFFPFVFSVSSKIWFYTSLLFSLLVGMCLYLFSPGVSSYVGFSGTLHGLLVIGLFHEFGQVKGRLKWVYVFVLLFVIGKVVREQLPGFDAMHLSNVIDGAVIVDAHMYGLIVGLVYCCVEKLIGFSKVKL
ncbi:rhombosortase [Teredinibacter sp. KSP-S5-2]|uniref:rhombosortase n=1 Tax=Teredinibacter sp. KSP-S5-2 TaxID=3034506 RepID=UPI0029343705|nr:rhombosortase [Teredinibacter sp. KSP-S5-2]WNO07710.1 rhombosortase [Teredinibacter sp. KSP-S5-2]